jgi:hypothetical protein
VHLELTWPRPDAAHRTLTIPVPDVPVSDLVSPALQGIQACTRAILRQALAHAEPVASGAAGAGALAHLAVPYATRLARQAFDQFD